jgi:metallophosphoesterase (TIGR00282 family)
VTLGNHTYRRDAIGNYLASSERVIRPANQGFMTPGRGLTSFEARNGVSVAVLSLLGSISLDTPVSPWEIVDALVDEARALAPVVIVDFHAEATSEKMAFSNTFDGLVSLVVGTHTHCPSADHQILPGGTAFLSDAGMSGDYDSVIGMQKQGASTRFWRKVPGERLVPAEGEATVCGVFVETDDATGLALRVEPLRQGGRLAQAMPDVGAD